VTGHVALNAYLNIAAIAQKIAAKSAMVGMESSQERRAAQIARKCNRLLLFQHLRQHRRHTAEMVYSIREKNAIQNSLAHAADADV
jgi:hypothetical protein